MRISTDPSICARYSQAGGIHRIIPRAVAQPVDLVEIAEAMAWAKDNGASVTPRGAGSAMDGSSVGAGLLLDMSRFCRGQLTIDQSASTAVVSPSISLGQLNLEAESMGLRFGPDPSSSEWATVGGVISTNAAGPRTYSLGPVSSWVLSVELLTDEGPLVLIRGKATDPTHPVVKRWHRDVVPMLSRYRQAIESRWPITKKNTAGYGLDRYWQSGDLIDIVIGSEGTLGLITGATLRLAARPTHRASLKVAVGHRDEIAPVVELLGEVEPTAIELLDQSLLEATRASTGIEESSEVGSLLLADFEDNDQDALMARLNRAVDLLTPIVVTVSGAFSAQELGVLWGIRREASARLAALVDGRKSLQIVEDGCVPIEALSRYLNGVQKSCDAVGVDVVMFGHAGDGHVHVNLLPNLELPDWKNRVTAIFHEVTDLVVQLRGSPAGEHGAGRLRARILEQVLGSEAADCFAAIKRCFDPHSRFNSGVIVPDGSDPFGQLKVGETAVALHDDIQTRLTRIETDRLWQVDRWA